MKNKKSKTIWAVIGGICLFSMVVAGIQQIVNPDGQTTSQTAVQPAVQPVTQAQAETPAEPVSADVANTEQATEASGDNDNSGYTIRHGELISAIESENDAGSVIVIKAKIESSWNNELTVKQNYTNAIDLIQNQGCDAYDQFQYWAVADTTSGEEVKVVSFTINKELIQTIKSGNMVSDKLGEYVDDLYILPSLQ